MNVWLLWILAAVVCGIIEVMSVSFVFLMFAIGALAAGVAAALGASVFVQVIVFAVVSLALLRPFLKGRIDRSGGYVRTNTDALIGKTAYVTEAVGERHGRVQFSGGEWSARTEGEELAVGTQVSVDRIDGATAVVSALDSSSHPPMRPTAAPAE